MRSILSITLLLCCVANRLCRGEERDKPVVVCSTTQVSDFTRQIVGDRWVVQYILAPGADLHLYRIKPTDNQTVITTDLCLENGLLLEGKDWMRALAKDAGKPLVSCTDGIKPGRLAVPGQDGTIRDPHAWFTPRNATVYVRNILRAVSQLDPEHAEKYEARAELYLDELRTLHFWIVRQVNAIPSGKRVLVTSHDAFNYFCREYEFTPAAPVGWSTGQEIGVGVTPAKRQAAIESIRQFDVKAIFVETSVNPELIREIATEANVEISGKLYSDSMGKPGSAGVTYIGMMRENVITIVHALK